MVLVNGVALDNPTFDWTLMRASRVLPVVARERPAVRIAGRDGILSGLPATSREVTLRLVVETPPANRETLVSLFRDAGVLSDAGREAVYEVAGVAQHELETQAPRVEVAVDVTVPGACWRAAADVTFTVALSAASVTLSAFPGISAPVADGLVRLTPAAAGVQVTDTSGAWVRLPDAAAGQWVRFEMDSGKCFRTTTDTWSGGVDISGLVDFGGPRGVFELTPRWVADPSVRDARVTVSSASRSGASVQVRGKAAFAM